MLISIGGRSTDLKTTVQLCNRISIKQELDWGKLRISNSNMSWYSSKTLISKISLIKKKRNFARKNQTLRTWGCKSMIKVTREIVGPKKSWKCKGRFKNGNWKLSKLRRKEYPFSFKINKKLIWTKKDNCKVSRKNLLKNSKGTNSKSVSWKRVLLKKKTLKEL